MSYPIQSKIFKESSEQTLEYYYELEVTTTEDLELEISTVLYIKEFSNSCASLASRINGRTMGHRRSAHS